MTSWVLLNSVEKTGISLFSSLFFPSILWRYRVQVEDYNRVGRSSRTGGIKLHNLAGYLGTVGSVP